MIDKFEKVKELINGSRREAFFQEGFGDYLSGCMTFTMGEDSYTMAFYRGEMIEVMEGLPLTGMDFGIKGPAEGWQELFKHRNFSMAIAPKHGQLRHQGNLVRSMGNLNATAFVCRALCDVMAD